MRPSILSEDEMDLLSAIAHEISHLLGCEHIEGVVMDEVLDTGIRTVKDVDAVLSARILPFSAPTGGTTRAPARMIDQSPVLSRGPTLKKARLGDPSFLMDADSGDLVPNFDVFDPHGGKSTYVLDEGTGLLVKSA